MQLPYFHYSTHLKNRTLPHIILLVLLTIPTSLIYADSTQHVPHTDTSQENLQRTCWMNLSNVNNFFIEDWTKNIFCSNIKNRAMFDCINREIQGISMERTQRSNDTQSVIIYKGLSTATYKTSSDNDVSAPWNYGLRYFRSNLMKQCRHHDSESKPWEKKKKLEPSLAHIGYIKWYKESWGLGLLYTANEGSTFGFDKKNVEDGIDGTTEWLTPGTKVLFEVFEVDDRDGGGLEIKSVRPYID